MKLEWCRSSRARNPQLSRRKSRLASDIFELAALLVCARETPSPEPRQWRETGRQRRSPGTACANSLRKAEKHAAPPEAGECFVRTHGEMGRSLKRKRTHCRKQHNVVAANQPS